MAYADVSWSYRDPITVQQLNQMVDNSVWTSEHRVFGTEVEVLGTGGGTTACVSPGAMCIDNKITYLSATSHLVATLTASWEEGVIPTDTITGSSHGWYVVAYDNGDGSFSTKFRQDPPVYTDTNSSTNTLSVPIYDKTGSTWLRYVGYVVWSTASALTKQYMVNGMVYADTLYDHVVITGVALVAWTDIDCSLHVPKMARNVQFAGMGSNTTLYTRTNDASGAGHFQAYANVGMNFGWMNTDENQVIEAQHDEAGTTVYIAGYDLSTSR